MGESMSLLMKLFCNLTPDPGVTAVLVFYGLLPEAAFTLTHYIHLLHSYT